MIRNPFLPAAFEFATQPDGKCIHGDQERQQHEDRKVHLQRALRLVDVALLRLARCTTFRRRTPHSASAAADS